MHSPSDFDPDKHEAANDLFGIPCTEELAQIVMIPLPWEVTVSYGGGTSKGPELIRDASVQADLYDIYWGEPWRNGWFMQPENYDHAFKSEWLNAKVQNLRDNPKNAGELKQSIDRSCAEFFEEIEKNCTSILQKGKIPAIIGGEHTSALPALQALNKQYEDFGILQIDAHADLRQQYEGLKYSHATIMHHAMQLNNLQQIAAVGIRDFSKDEVVVMKENQDIYRPFFSSSLHERLFDGDTWRELCQEIVNDLPDNVYISFDIDGLEPWLCPGTGTPVPGGLDYFQAVALLREVFEAGKKIIGFDLTEVAPSSGEWDGNTGARILYNLCAATSLSNKQHKSQEK